MFNPEKNNFSRQTTAIIIIALVVAVIILAVLLKYFIFTGIRQTVGNNQSLQRTVDPVQLSETYKAQSSKIISDFLEASGNNGTGIGLLALQAQQKMLALSLPVQFKQKHLAEVLLLGEISDLSASGHNDQAVAKVDELRRIFTQE